MKRYTIDDIGAFLILVAIVVAALFLTPSSCAENTPRRMTPNQIRELVREEMERAKTGAAPAEEGR